MSKGLKLLFRCTAIAGLAIVLTTQGLHAAEIRVTRSVNGELTYSNNVNLDEDEEGGFSTQISPSIRVSAKGARFQGDLAYTVTGVMYGSEGDNRLDHSLTSKATLEAIDQFFYVDTSANVRQELLSPFGAQPTSSSSDTDNRYQSLSYSIAPYIKGHLFYDTTYEVRNEHTWTDSSQVSSDVDSLGNAYENDLRARFDTPIRLFGLSGEYSNSKTEYDGDDTSDLTRELSRGIIYYRPDPQFTISVRGGYESDDYGVEEQSGSFYGFGLQWSPSPRTSFDGFWEDRYFGAAYNVRLQHRRPLSFVSLSASRDISTYADNINGDSGLTYDQVLDSLFIGQFPDPVQRAAAVQAQLALWGVSGTAIAPSALYTNQATLQERLNLSIGLLGARNTVTLTLYMSEQESVAGSDGDILIPDGSANFSLVAVDNVKQRGASITWNHRLTALMQLTATLSRDHSKSEEPDNIETTQDRLTVRLTKPLAPKTNAYVGGRIAKGNSEDDGSDYDELAIFVGLHHTF